MRILYIDIDTLRATDRGSAADALQEKFHAEI